jgi:hypothetical protein
MNIINKSYFGISLHLVVRHVEKILRFLDDNTVHSRSRWDISPKVTLPATKIKKTYIGAGKGIDGA